MALPIGSTVRTKKHERIILVPIKSSHITLSGIHADSASALSAVEWTQAWKASMALSSGCSGSNIRSENPLLAHYNFRPK